MVWAKKPSVVGKCYLLTFQLSKSETIHYKDKKDETMCGCIYCK